MLPLNILVLYLNLSCISELEFSLYAANMFMKEEEMCKILFQANKNKAMNV